MITFVVPVYNAEVTLARCLDSILKQDYADIEIIAINDGSSDRSLQILMEYCESDSRIKVINQNNSGVSVARNKGILHASGEYIMFVDSDDYIEPNTCSSLLEYMKEGIDLVIFGLNIYKEGRLLRTPHLETAIVHIKNDINDYWNLRTINLGPCNKIYRKALIKSLFDETLSLGEDTLFVLEYLKNIHTIQIVDKCFYNVSLDNTGSLNRKYRDDRLEQLIKVRHKEFEILNEIYPYNKDTRIYEEYFRNLHIILTNLMRMRIANKFTLFKSNIKRFDYPFKCTRFNNKYYSLFAFLIINRLYILIYLFIALRVLFERIILSR